MLKLAIKSGLLLLVLASPALADDTDRKIRELEDRIENLEGGGLTPREAHCARDLLGLNSDPVPFQCPKDMDADTCKSLQEFYDKMLEDLDVKACN